MFTGARELFPLNPAVEGAIIKRLNGRSGPRRSKGKREKTWKKVAFTEHLNFELRRYPRVGEKSCRPFQTKPPNHQLGQ